MFKGKFVTFEGCEGAGKSTQVRLVEKYLKERNIPFVLTREPGGTQIAEEIRKIILDKKNMSMCDVCEAFLYSASRVQHLNEVIIPALNAGKLVICDRYIDSTMAYQGYARGLGVDFVKELNRLTVKEYVPDLTIFLDIHPKEAFKRKGGADKNDRLEQMKLDFHEKVYLGYKEIAKQEPDRFYVVDATGQRYDTHHNIIGLLKVKGFI